MTPAWFVALCSADVTFAKKLRGVYFDATARAEFDDHILL